MHYYALYLHHISPHSPLTLTHLDLKAFLLSSVSILLISIYPTSYAPFLPLLISTLHLFHSYQSIPHCNLLSLLHSLHSPPIPLLSVYPLIAPFLALLIPFSSSILINPSPIAISFSFSLSLNSPSIPLFFYLPYPLQSAVSPIIQHASSKLSRVFSCGTRAPGGVKEGRLSLSHAHSHHHHGPCCLPMH